MKTPAPLATMAKDMTFYPTQNPNPQRLTQREIKQFNDQGYLMGYTIFRDAEVQANRVYFDELLREAAQAGIDPGYGIADYHVTSQKLYDIARHPLILEYVADLLGPNVVLWHSHVFAKPPGETKSVPWHQDASYWPLTPTKTITVWLAIDDSDRGNGALQIIPGTHQGIVDYEVVDREKTANVLSKKIVHAEQYGEPVFIELKAGQISIHPDMMAHGSQPNQSNRRRCGLTLRYCPVDVRAYLDPQRESQPGVRSYQDYNKKSVLVLGTDESGYWANVPRPTASRTADVHV